jgi:tRNA(fMet)-specific endonuclease VapC
MELRFGLERTPNTRSAQAIEEFLDTIRIEHLPDDIAVEYGRVRAELEKRGRPIGALDTIIAAHAVAIRAVLVTNNGREFGRVKGLRWQDWNSG